MGRDSNIVGDLSRIQMALSGAVHTGPPSHKQKQTTTNSRSGCSLGATSLD
ncbi:hypothetical protein J6590_042897 [Homalodisca vitripennis]|nr:hypothetical protein J6590_042897 [Homalodisca vitripennis]